MDDEFVPSELIHNREIAISEDILLKIREFQKSNVYTELKATRGGDLSRGVSRERALADRHRTGICENGPATGSVAGLARLTPTASGWASAHRVQV